MAHVDEAAAELEVEKAAECTAQAQQLVAIANGLQDAARLHLEEADGLRGSPRDPSDDERPIRKPGEGTSGS
jgi:hypothetical protein